MIEAIVLFELPPLMVKFAPEAIAVGLLMLIAPPFEFKVKLLLIAIPFVPVKEIAALFVVIVPADAVVIWFPELSVSVRPDVLKFNVSPFKSRLILLLADNEIFAVLESLSRYLVVTQLQKRHLH